MFALCLELQPAEVRNAFVSLDIALCPNYRFPGFLSRGRVARCIRAIIFVFVCFSFTSSLGVGYLMVCTASYPNVLAFCFLDELQKEFIVTYDTKRIESAMRPYSFIEFGESVELCVSAETTTWEICQLFKLKRVPCLMVPIRCKIGLILYNIQFLKFLLGSAQILQYGVTVSKFQIQKREFDGLGLVKKYFMLVDWIVNLPNLLMTSPAKQKHYISHRYLKGFFLAVVLKRLLRTGLPYYSQLQQRKPISPKLNKLELLLVSTIKQNLKMII